MSTVDLVASTVLDAVASLMNDTAKTTYGYTATIPYLRLAMNELQEMYELNGVSSAEETSSVITIPIGTEQIIFNGGTAPTLPSDLIEPLQLWERQTGTDSYIPMTRREFLPHNIEGITINRFVYWIWQDNIIKFFPANQSNDIKIDYIKTLFPDLVDENSLINVINAKVFLEYRTAALCCNFIERNEGSANSNNTYAVMALDRALGIGIKGKQAITTRRRPFRQNYKTRSWVS